MQSARTATGTSCSTPASVEKTAQLAYTKGQMTLAELYARFWTTKAEMTGKPDDLKVAKMHMIRYQDLLDHQDALLRDKEPT